MGSESGEDGYILNVRFSASLQCSALMSQATDRNHINIEIRGWGGDNPGVKLHDIESHPWGVPLCGSPRGGLSGSIDNQKSQQIKGGFYFAFMHIWVREGRLEKVVAFSKGEVSRKRAFWRHMVANMVGEH